MKKIFLSVAGLSFLLVVSQPVGANCTPLINEGRALLSKANLPADESNKIKTLLDEAAQSRDAGDHATGAKKASEALNLLKTK